MSDPYLLAYLCTGLIIAMFIWIRMWIRTHDPASTEHNRIGDQLAEMHHRYPTWFVAFALTVALTLATAVIIVSWPAWCLTNRVDIK